MTRDEVLRLAECVSALATRLAAEPRLAAEVLRARRQFFGRADETGSAAAEHRFVEWFLLERDSETLGAAPCTVPPFAEAALPLAGSLAGVFLVQSTGAGGVLARDLQDDAVVELDVDAGAVDAGDLVVGRLYPSSGERWLVSIAAPVLRPGRELATAFAHDLERLDLDRRLQQIELEYLLLRHQPHAEPGDAAAAAAPASVPLEHLEADLERLLVAAGGRHSATAISQQLAAIERPGPVLGPLLDQLAVDTDVDLDRARQLLLEIWNAHHGASLAPEPQTPDPRTRAPGETLGERLVRTLDEGLQQKRDVGELFAQLESMAGVDDSEDDDDDDDRGGDGDGDEEREPGDAIGDETGDLEPLIEEYLWETGHGDAPGVAAPLRLWSELQRNAPLPRTDFERIASDDLMRFLLHVYLRARPTQRAVEVRAAFAELHRFYDWVAAAQEIDCRAVLGECRGALLDQVDRLEAAGRQLSNTAPPERAPTVLQVEDLGADGFGVRDDDGGHHWLLAGAAAVGCLRVGDLVLGALGVAAGTGKRALAGLVVVLPVDARALIE